MHQNNISIANYLALLILVFFDVFVLKTIKTKINVKDDNFTKYIKSDQLLYQPICEFHAMS